MQSQSRRGVLYIVWGEKANQPLQRSIASLREHHPELPIQIEECPPPTDERGLAYKTRMGKISDFESTLYLDADTIIMGNLHHAFAQSERFGLACCICECPWMRRYDPALADQTEYNTGVLFFSSAAKGVFDHWERFADSTPSSSRWTTLDDRPRGLAYDDQASFARAVRHCEFNPHILPINYNLRPAFHGGVFAPVKIWHDYRHPPAELVAVNTACERGERPVTWVRWNLR